LLQGRRWFPPPEPAGSALARGIANGPDENFERLRMTQLGAITAARSATGFTAYNDPALDYLARRLIGQERELTETIARSVA
jgi:hypothetical protein